MIAEAVGGWLANSLALLADAGHMLTDVAALSLTLLAIWFAARPATPKKTYGYYRLEILAAFANGVLLVVISLWVLYKAYSRWLTAPEISGPVMTTVAFGGLLVNIAAAVLLHGGQKNDLNLRGAWLHVIGDMLGSVAAMAAGVLILVFGWRWSDSAASAIIALIIIYSAWNLIRESVNVLLEGTPSHINLASVEDSIRKIEYVRDVHDLHVWTITSGIEALSVHIVHSERAGQEELLKSVREEISGVYGIEHLTIQLESMSRREFDELDCSTGANCFEAGAAGKTMGQ